MAPRKPALRKPKKGYRKGYKNKISKNVKNFVYKAIKRDNNKMIETKQGTMTSTDGQEIFHNSFVSRTDSLLFTSQGTADPPNSSGTNRIGDKINLVGVSIKMMLELNERYSQALFKILVVRSARGDVPTAASLYNSISGNKMLDTYNTERYSILVSKLVTIRQSSTGMNSSGIQEVGSGFASGVPLISRASKIVKIWIPGKKFTRSGVIEYDNGQSKPKFFDYHLLVYAYSNYSTATTYYVGRVNDEVIITYFKDA